MRVGGHVEVRHRRDYRPVGLLGWSSSYVEGSDDGQSFIVLLSIPSGTMGTAQSVHLNRSLPFGSGARLYRILRWRLATSGIAWEYCGRANVVLK